MSGLAELGIWNDHAIRDALSWYLAVAENRRPAKFRIAATIATELDLSTFREDTLWSELERLTEIMLERWQAIRDGAPLPPPVAGPNLLDLCRALAWRMLTHCNFCPWNCRVDRISGSKFGACKLAAGSSSCDSIHSGPAATLPTSVTRIRFDALRTANRHSDRQPHLGRAL
jgi:putative pyruvate formate lyase activating enzyme